jgi:hypothetical protein
MVRSLPFARPAGTDHRTAATGGTPGGLATRPAPTAACEHRTVSRDGRIVCKKIVEGQAEVSPNDCRQCPARAVNCQHLRFSLRLSSPSPLVVRFNGRTELWDDGPAELCFDRAACAERVMPIRSPQACAECAVRQAAWCEVPPATNEAGHGRVVAFPLLAVAPSRCSGVVKDVPLLAVAPSRCSGVVKDVPLREAVAAAG